MKSDKPVRTRVELKSADVTVRTVEKPDGTATITFVAEIPAEGRFGPKLPGELRALRSLRSAVLAYFKAETGRAKVEAIEDVRRAAILATLPVSRKVSKKASKKASKKRKP